jgi:hypothetical protein
VPTTADVDGETVEPVVGDDQVASATQQQDRRTSLVGGRDTLVLLSA